MLAADGFDYLHSELTAEGEGEATDLVAFASDLNASGTKLFCASWSALCAQQRQLFEDGDSQLPYIEVGTPDRRGNSIAAAEGITNIPTWQFPDGTRTTGLSTLEELSTLSGVSIPTGELPSLAQLGTQQVLVGSPLHLAIDAYNPAGGPLSVDVEVADDSVIVAEVLTGNRSLRLETADYGDMVFELFEGRAPRPAGRVIELAESGFYDGVVFHRVIDSFVIQGGDPTGTGAGGSTLGNFDDQFYLDLQHNATGLLSYAKSSDDTNDSQFFIAEGPQRHLDFNHSVFGMLVEGESIRDAISATATTAGDRPLFNIPIERASVFEDSENSVVVLRGLKAGETTDVTVTVTNADGLSTSQVFQVTTAADDFNTPAFLQDVKSGVAGVENSDVVVQLDAVDREGDEVAFQVEVLSLEGATAVVDEAGLVTITPPQDFVGEVRVRASVADVVNPLVTDMQEFSVEFYSAHHNRERGIDVNSDGAISPIDVLLIINFLNSGASSNSTIGLPPVEGVFRDANDDRFIAPNDALLVINYLNSDLVGEGERDVDQPRGLAIESLTEEAGQELQAAAIASLMEDERKRR
ncbi:MAG: hypothetical protein Aurels2KO_05370 [Aureliella sp.]